MAKCLNKLSLKIHRKIEGAFRCCFPILKLLVGFCNTLLVAIGGAVLGAAAFMYIAPAFHIFLDALKNIFNVHSIFGSAIILGALTVCIGVAGIYFLIKGCYDKLGLQAATFLILLIVMAAVTFAFWIEWKENAHFGISYATQSYNPKDEHGTYFKSIQEFLLCCGSSGPGDFDIANEFFKEATVPISCCNHLKYPSNCSEMSRNIVDGKGSLAISVHLAFETGCMTQMEKVIWPIIMYIIFLQAGLSFLCMIASAIVVMGYESYIVPGSRNSVKNSSVDLSDHDHDESIKLEYQT